MKKKNQVEQIKPALNKYPGRLVIVLGICVLWMYYHSCLEYIWALNTPSGIVPSNEIYIHVLPGEAATFSRNASSAFCADWLYFNNLRGPHFRLQESNNEILYFFERAEYFIKLNRELTDIECLEAQSYLVAYRNATQKKQKEHTHVPYQIFYIGLLIAGVFFYIARKKYNFYISLPSKYEKWTYMNTNFLLLMFFLVQPIFVTENLFVIDSSGKLIMRELCDLRAYLANPAYLKDTTEGKELFYAYLPYAYALGVHMQWALRCLYVYPQGTADLYEKLEEINIIRARIRSIQSKAESAGKRSRRLFGILK